MTSVSLDSVAVIGMACRVPGAKDYSAFWRNLKEGTVSISRFTPEELRRAGVQEECVINPAYIPAKPNLDGLDEFDAGFFGFSERDAALTDPQHRVFLETAWEAFEDAGYVPGRHLGRVGVFASAGKNTYLIRNLLLAADWSRSPEVFQLLLGNEKDYVATRVAFAIDATGPAISIQSACSSSLVAVHLACQSLLSGECDFALAGGVNIDVPAVEGYWHRPHGILSPDGHCRPFTPGAAGTVFGQGSAAVVLRRYSESDRDTVRAIIRGSAVNNDGGRCGFSAPSEAGQGAVISEAIGVAGVEVASIGYVEAHGTATLLGDAIEIRGLERAFQGVRAGSCAVGAVKANLGHLGAAAGIVGLCKAILARQHSLIPPTPYGAKGNPPLGMPNGPFVLNTELRQWPAQSPRAGVSSFGQGGTNAHVILDAASPLATAPLQQGLCLVVISARSIDELDDCTDRLCTCLASTDQRLCDIAFTLFSGRTWFRHRRVVIGRTHREIIDALQSRNAALVADGIAIANTRPVEFLLPKPQHLPSDDFCAHSGYRTALSEFERSVCSRNPAAAAQYALARCWMALGVKPHGIRGIDEGEQVAAVLRGEVELKNFRSTGISLAPTKGISNHLVTLELAPKSSPAGLVVGGNTEFPSDSIEAVLGQLWLAGADLDQIATPHQSTARHVPLPTYPFRRKSFWVRAPEPPTLPFATVASKSDNLGTIVSTLYANFLGLEEVSPTDNFVALGGTSLIALNIVTRLEDFLGIELDPDLVFRHPTPLELTTRLQSAGSVTSSDEELACRDILRFDVKTSEHDSCSFDSILLTGSTGFLGAHLLEEVLTATTAEVTCLIRGETLSECQQRLTVALQRYSIPIDVHSPRLRIVVGDVAKRQFGLRDRDYQELAGNTDTIFHAAATVSFVQPYEELRQTNVLGVVEVLKFADSGMMAVHLASSVAVFECATLRGRREVAENDDLVDCRGFPNGYGLSKWVAEMIARRRHSKNTFIHRISNVAGHSVRGVMTSGQILVAFLRGCLELGRTPGQHDSLNVIPVDIAARWMVQLAERCGCASIYHIVHPRSLAMRDIIEWLRIQGHPLEFCPEDEWREQVSKSNKNSFRPFLSLVDRRSLFANRQFDMQNVREVLGDRVVDQCPTMGDSVFAQYYASIVRPDN